MKQLTAILVTFITLQVISLSAQGQNEVKQLFKSEDILQLKITMNVEEVIKDVEVRDNHEATLTYKEADGSDNVLNIKVVVRGKTRTNTKVCRFPPLKLNFKKKQVKKTVFAGQNKLKLVTHCNSKAINEEYILREYYVYKLHQLVTPFSFRVRLCKITYEDTAGDFDSAESHYGILIEDIDDLAERNGMTEYEGNIISQDVCDRVELDRLMLFQYLIGNLDWSVPKRHNFKIVADSLKPVPVAIPYDFDYTGMVNTSYAKVPPEIGVTNVRVRVFRGLCRMQGGYDDVLIYYQDLKPEIYALYNDSDLSAKSKASAIKFIDGFYKVLDNPKQFEQKVVKACRANHKHMFQY